MIETNIVIHDLNYIIWNLSTVSDRWCSKQLLYEWNFYKEKNFQNISNVKRSPHRNGYVLKQWLRDLWKKKVRRKTAVELKLKRDQEYPFQRRDEAQRPSHVMYNAPPWAKTVRVVDKSQPGGEDPSFAELGLQHGVLFEEDHVASSLPFKALWHDMTRG